jgi:hypothetical protein
MAGFCERALTKRLRNGLCCGMRAANGAVRMSGVKPMGRRLPGDFSHRKMPGKGYYQNRKDRGSFCKKCVRVVSVAP